MTWFTLFCAVACGATAIYYATGWAVTRWDRHIEERRRRQRERDWLRCTECYALVRYGDMPAHWQWHDSLDRELQEVGK